MEILKHLLIAILITAALWAVSTTLLFLIGFGHVKVIRALISIRRTIPRLPAGAVFHSRDGQVTMTWYNGAQDTDENLLFARFSKPTLLTWKSGRGKSRAAVGRRVTAELTWRTALLALVTVPLFVATVWLAVNESWLWVYATLFLVAHYALRMVTNQIFFLRFGVVSYVTANLFLERARLWHPSPTIAASLLFGVVMSAMAFLVMAERMGSTAADSR
ncbi:hypothetical protein [Streptomyces sp. NBC_00887]|uniref:hypothetical protein n=1 Tax=Streptomyces sp. NBC_00887 TaxID=2975859 RepID=UPI0038691D56|nr:hypothetical protein OG844_00195 [Streptomyces sp. NBC_00887]WSY36373.1 hypothetical protein OG844_45405 [Streptomyces sp. NBC_00887]